jgi:diguanylate cyclase (GGDEF)-like protein
VREGVEGEAAERSLRTSWRTFAGAFVVLGVLMLLRLTSDRARPLDWLLLVLLVVVGLLAVRLQVAVRDLEAGRRTAVEGFARILRGLSRSVSPDAIVAAIVEELGHVTGADHIVVVQRRPRARGLEATLVSSRPGLRSSTMLLPISDLDDPLVETNAIDGGGRLSVGLAVEPSATGFAGARIDPGPVAVAVAPSLALAVTASEAAEPAPAGPTQLDGDVAFDRASGRRVAGRIAARVGSVYGLQHTLAEPLVADGRVVGALVLSRRVAGSWPSSVRRLLLAAAGEASIALERAYSHREAEAAATTDALTGLPNRRYFDEFCGLLARRRRAEDAVGVLMIDIDRFKALNDRFGHQVGDHVLRAVARSIAATVREADVPARYGGEEFAVLLRNPNRLVALEVAERVRSAVAALDLRRFGVPGVSVSVGVAVASVPDQPIVDLLASADRALYRAKRTGRDRVVAAA